MASETYSEVPKLEGYNVERNQNSVSGLSSGAFMTVQLHLAHSSNFIGAGIIAGGPYRCVESFRDAAPQAEEAYLMNALYICMAPLIPQTAPNAGRLAELARETAATGKIDPIANLADDRLYIFTGSKDTVVYQDVVKSTRNFYQQLGIKAENIKYVDTVPAGHAIITNNIEDLPLASNRPPYINYGRFMQSHDILRHIYGDLLPPAEYLSGELVCFNQTDFLDDNAADASMGQFGYVYVPAAVKRGDKARGVHIVLHGGTQGFSYVNFVNGRPDIANQAPYGSRYIMTTGYNHIADSNKIIVLYPQATGDDDNAAQNPKGEWDWWGYTSPDPRNPNYYSKDAIQIKAIHKMLQQLCSGRPAQKVSQS